MLALGLVPKVPKTGVHKHCKSTFSIRLTSPPLQVTPATIRLNLILPETSVIGIQLRRYCMCLSSFNFSWLAPKTHFETECVTAVQGHQGS